MWADMQLSKVEPNSFAVTAFLDILLAEVGWALLHRMGVSMMRGSVNLQLVGGV